MDKKNKNENKDTNEMLRKFVRQKYILLISLVFAVLSILMDQEIIPVESRVTNAFTIAAAVGIVMYLLKESFSKKAERYRAALERLHEMEEEEAMQAEAEMAYGADPDDGEYDEDDYIEDDEDEYDEEDCNDEDECDEEDGN